MRGLIGFLGFFLMLGGVGGFDLSEAPIVPGLTISALGLVILWWALLPTIRGK